MKLQDRKLSSQFYTALSKARAKKALKSRIQFMNRVDRAINSHFDKVHVMGGK